MRAALSLPLALLFVSASIAACGPPGATPLDPARASGQSALMGQTFAGQNACNPKDHDRPFIVEWDATDTSSFESRAGSDVVFVRYEGCKLQVIDTCTSDSVRGTFGSYLPADWTSGSLEKIEIGSEAELVAKLPLGVGSLGGRVRGGDKFHMEYFVAGTRRATRPFVYKGEIDKIPGCRGVTHAVYAYNLGAFALGSLASVNGEIGGTFWGVEAGVSGKSSKSAEKKGGELASCRGKDAKETASCQAPIRLTLREIQEGDNPDAKAAVAPAANEALNLVGKLQATNDQERAAGEHLSSAQAKRTAGDGKGCLRELDDHDRLDPRPGGLSTSPKGFTANLRSRCLMASGQCEAGKALLRKSIQGNSPPGTTPEVIDGQVDMWAGMSCRGTDASPRDQLLFALSTLQGSQVSVDARTCRATLDTIKRIGPTMKSDDPSPQIKNMWQSTRNNASMCFARSGDCAGAWTAEKESAELLGKYGTYQADDERQRFDFTQRTRDKCLGKPQGTLTPREEMLRAAADLAMSRDVPTPAAACKALYDKGRAGVSVSGPGKAPPETERAARLMRDGALTCMSKASDCASAWRAFTEMYPVGRNSVTDRNMREAFDDDSSARACRFKPQGTLSPRERAFFLFHLLERHNEADRATCTNAYRDLSAVLAQLRTGTKEPDLDNLRSSLGDRASRCLVRAHACDEAKRVFVLEERELSNRRGGAAPDDAAIEKRFASRYSECRP